MITLQELPFTVHPVICGNINRHVQVIDINISLTSSIFTPIVRELDNLI